MAKRKKKKPKRRTNLSLKNFHTNKSIIKGRVFEFIIGEILTKAGFSEDFETDQITKDRKKLHGRGGTYAPDFYGVFKIGIPFVNPILLVVEAKNFNKKVGLHTVREFLGAYIDFSQYVKIDTKTSNLNKKYEKLYEPRFTYCPLFFSMKGYEKPAQAFMYAHGINYISYHNSSTFEKIIQITEAVLSEIHFQKFTKTDFQKLKSIKDLSEIRNLLKKDGFANAMRKFKRFIELLNSYIAVIDYRFPVNILHKGRLKNTWYKNVSIQHVADGKFVLKNNKTKTIGEFTLPKFFLKEYVSYSKRKNKLDNVFKNISIINSEKGNFEIRPINISDNSRTDLIDAVLNLNVRSENPTVTGSLDIGPEQTPE